MQKRWRTSMWTTASTANSGRYRISSGRHEKLKAHINAYVSGTPASVTKKCPGNSLAVMQQTSSPHSRFRTEISRKQYWCLKKCPSLDFSFRPELQARPNKRKEHCGRSGGRTLFCQVSTSAIVLRTVPHGRSASGFERKES